jgi:hypothetical protein
MTIVEVGLTFTTAGCINSAKVKCLDQGTERLLSVFVRFSTFRTRPTRHGSPLTRPWRLCATYGISGSLFASLHLSSKHLTADHSLHTRSAAIAMWRCRRSQPLAVSVTREYECSLIRRPPDR